jgi:transposase
MSAKKHLVTLICEQREKAEIVARSYKHSERERKRARILLQCDTSRPEAPATDEAVAAQVGVALPTVRQTRRRFAQGGLEAALYQKPQQKRKARVLNGEAEAFLIATVCSAAPEGCARWTLHLLADKLVAQGYAESVSHETVRQTLKKMNLSPG